MKIGPGVNLYIRQTADFVWLCFTAPPGSFATADLELEAPGLAGPIDLHASAQLGEWDPRHAETAPATPADDKWWKITGWTGTTNHFRPARQGQDLEFFPTPARELQLSKARFGRGEWRMSLKIGGLKDMNGTRGELRWPADGRRYRLTVE